MINIRPVSDLKNKYQEIEELILKDNEDVYLTKDGYGSMVMLSIERYSDLMQEINIKRSIDELKENDIENSNIQYLPHKEMLPKARKVVSDKK